MKLAQTYKKQGMDMSEAMKKAYAEIDKSQYETAENSKSDAKKFAQNWENAGKNVSDVADKIKNGLATAAKIGTAAITAAAGGIAALTKSSVDGYAEYEQLVGGVETLFDKSAGKVQEYAANAYKTAGMTANEYMQTVTSFSASLINSLATSTETATGAVTEATINSLNKQLEAMQDTQDKNVEAVENANEREIELLEEAYEKELADFEKLTEERIKLIDKQYAENMKLVDEEEYRRLQAVQAQIDAINAEQAADDKAAKQREENEKKAALQEKTNTAETAEEKKKAQEEYNKYLEELRQEQIEADRKARIDSLKSEKEAIKEEADAKRDELKKQRDNDVKVIQESAAVELQERKKGQAAQLKALKDSQVAELKALKDSNKQKLDAMRDYIAEQKKLVTDGYMQVINVTDETRAKAAELADMAITDMSDNANKMGSDMAMLQNAYNGFAKQNYTMLDNLKLGYGGTKEEMQRLLERAEELSGFEYDISSYADIVQAIHVIQEDMKITGTTAKEAGTTISGALAAAGAAWSNLVTGMSDKNADISQLIDNFVTTITGDGSDTNLGVFGTLIPTVEKALNGVGELISKLLPVAMAKIPDIIKTTLPTLITAAGSIVTAIGQGILENATLIVTYAQQVITDFVKSILENLPEIVQAGIDIIVTLTNGATEMWKELFPALVDAILGIADVLTNSENLDKMIDAAIDLAIAISDGLMNGLPKILDKAPEIVEKIAAKLIERGPDIVDAGIKIIGRLFEDMPQILMTLGESVQEMIDGIVDKFLNHDWAATGKQIVGSIKDAATKAWSNWEDFGASVQEMGANSTIFGYIGNKIAGVETESGISRGGRRDSGGMNVTYNITTPITDQDTLDKSAQRFWNDYAYGH